MTNRDHFIAALDAAPHDQLTRLVFADWLEENAECEADIVLATSLRWMANNGKWPMPMKSRSWLWFYHDNFGDNCCIIEKLPVRDSAENWYSVHVTRHAAEVALAKALWEAGITRPSTFVPI